jgi:small conductance mechanosensitive channel
MTKNYSRYVFEIGVSYRENIDEVFEVIRDVDEELREHEEIKHNILQPIEIWGLDRFDDSAIIIKARITTLAGKQWAVARAFNKLLKEKFDKLNIEIPYPHLTLEQSKEKENYSSPLRT